MRVRPLLPLAVVVLVAVLAGCGGGGGDGKIESRADFIAAADKVCADRDKRSVKLAQGTHNGNVADVTRQLAAIYSDTIARIEGIALPPGSARGGAQAFVASNVSMRKPVARMKASADAVEAAVRSSATAVKKSVQQLQINVNTVQAIGDATDQSARDYGFKTCGQQQQINPVS